MGGFTKPVLHDSFALKDAKDRQLTSCSYHLTTVRGCGDPVNVTLGLCPEGVVA
jgi:hypothetical protein